MKRWDIGHWNKTRARCMTEGGSDIELPHSVRGDLELRTITGRKSCKEDENWEGCRSGRTVGGSSESKRTSGNHMVDEAV